MELIVDRKWPKADYTIGNLVIDGKVVCNTLEDTDRGLVSTMDTATVKKAKVYGKTAIPKGRYRIRWTYSPSFGRRTWAVPYGGYTPELADVKGFDGIRIHPGNTAADTYGCILVGRNTVKGQVTASTANYRNLLDKYLVPAIRRGESIWITIK